MKTKLLLLCFFALLASLASSQTPLSLEQAITRGLENNVEFKQQSLIYQMADQQLLQAYSERLPTVNFFTNQYFNIGRGLNQLTYRFENQYFDLNSFSLVSGLTLYNGKKIHHTIKQNEFAKEASKYEVQTYKLSLTMNIMSRYFDVLQYQEQRKVVEEQLKITQIQMGKSQVMMKEKMTTVATILELEAQQAQEEYDLANTINLIQQSKLALSQLLRIDTLNDMSYEDLQISNSEALDVKDSLENLSVHDIYKMAKERMPQVKMAMYVNQSNLKAVQSAKASAMPKLSLMATVGTGYTSSIVTAADSTRPETYSNQLKNNQNYTLGFNLELPIANNRKIRSEIQLAKIQMSKSEYQRQVTEQNLYREIAASYSQYSNAMLEYKAAQKYAVAMEKLFANNTVLFQNRMMNGLDYLNSKNKYEKAKINQIQVKYKLLLHKKIMELYFGKF